MIAGRMICLFVPLPGATSYPRQGPDPRGAALQKGEKPSPQQGLSSPKEDAV